VTPSRPRVVVDARMATDGGIGTYLQALVPRIARLREHWQIALLGNLQVMRELGWQAFTNIELRHCAAPIFSVREQVELPFLCGRDADLYWAPNYNVPWLLRRPLVVTIHDVNHLALPELMGGVVRRLYARRMLTSAVTRATRLLFDSEFTRRETERVLGRACRHGSVVHAGVETQWTEAQSLAPERPLAEPYFLYVGNIKRHKNVPFLLRAFERVRHDLPHRLVLAGRTEGIRSDPDVTTALSALNGRALMLGEVPLSVLRQYVAHAQAVVTASLYEGFGLPPLEAMAAGCPCLVSNAGSLPEICGDAALYCDPRDEATVVAGLLRLAREPGVRADLVRRGRERAARFSWDVCASRTVAVLEQAQS
jgi:glycosyltransferase involved in cell wall biosynthesis